MNEPQPFSDTIAAIATAPGAGGVGIVRISGPDAPRIAALLFTPSSPSFSGFVPRMMHHGTVHDARGTSLDEVLAVHFRGPKSFTGEDVVEFQCHGGPVVLEEILDAVLAAGARRAGRGEFTKRAFLNGRIDLSQAEAVAELIAAPSREGANLASAKLGGLLGRRIEELRARLEHLRQRICLAIDFPDEEARDLPADEFLRETDDIEAGVRRLLASYDRTLCWQEGALVVLCGRVNAGKSSLMNALLGRPRAIVTDRPGTTRDYLEETAFLDGLPVRLVDTAGLRDAPGDPIEQEGIRRGRELAGRARCTIIVLDGTESAPVPEDAVDAAEAHPVEADLVRSLGPERCAVVWNKNDAAPAPARARLFAGAPMIPASALEGEGIEDLSALARRICTGPATPADGEAAPNRRQAEQLRLAGSALADLRAAVLEGVPADLCGIHLERAAEHLGGITGLNTPEETLNGIFSSFCIGK